MSEKRPSLKAERLVYFSDAVVAIAITLLVLPLVDLVPEALDRHESTAELLRHNTGPIIAFLVSFVVIARIWTVHHALFDSVERVVQPVVAVDMLWLLTIVVLPFPTALTGGSVNDPDTVRLYVGVLTTSLLALTVLTALVRGRWAQTPEPPSARFQQGVAVSLFLLAVAFVVTLLVPRPSLTVLLVLFVDPLVDGLWSRVRGLRAGTSGDG